MQFLKAFKQFYQSLFIISSFEQNNKSIKVLCWTSFFWGMASVMVFSLLPLFIKEELGASTTKIGLIEGVAFFLSFVAKVFSGIISDFIKKRKILIALGAFGSILVKILFAISGNIGMVFFAKSMDRFSKGIRAAPTDALIADLIPLKKNGKSYATRHAFDMLGAVCGGALACLIIYFFPGHYRLVFWLSLIPSIIAFLLLKIGIKDKPMNISYYQKVNQWRITDIQKLPKSFWQLLGITFILMLARFSESFLTLRMREVGWSVASLPLIMIGYDLMSALTAFFMSKVINNFNKKIILLIGISILTLSDFLIIFAPTERLLFISILLIGLHMGMTQGLLLSLVAESTLPHLKGTAFAMYYFVVGISILIGNCLAGFLSDVAGSTIGAFTGGMIFTSLAMIYITYITKENSFHEFPPFKSQSPSLID